MKTTFVLPPLNLSGGIRMTAVYAPLLAARGHEVVPNPVDLHQVSAPAHDKQAVPVVGRLHSQATGKGCDQSLRAPLLLLAGSHKVRRPEQDRLSGLDAHCGVGLFGSRVEGWGLPILEAMAAANVRVCSLGANECQALSAQGNDRATRYPWDDAAALFEAAVVRT